MNRYILAFLLLLGFIGCNSNRMKKVERNNEPTIYLVNDDDKEMNTAIEEARQNIGKFDIALKEKKNRFDNFCLKVCFETEEHKEHIWICDITIKNNDFFGVINNLPEYIIDINIGDTVKINKENISDWMYTDNGILKGGYTIRLLRNRMSETERIQFDTEVGIIFDE